MNRRLRRKPRIQSSISLFSFIDVIGGVIGVLSLIIIGISLSHVVPESSSSPTINSQKFLTEKENQQKIIQINDLRKKITAIKMQQPNTQKANLKLEVLQQNVDQIISRQRYAAVILEEKELLHKRIRELDKKRALLQLEISKQRKYLMKKKGKMVRDKIEVLLTGRGQGLKSTFVECTNKGLIIKDGETNSIIFSSIISTSDTFHLLLKHVKEKDKGTIIFLIRPNGIRSFNLAMARTNEYGVRTGKLPIPGSGEIDLSHYTNE